MKILSKNLAIKSNSLDVVLESLRNHGGQARLVGGAVRDYLIGIKPSDIDIATDLDPKKVMKALSEDKIKAIPTGIKFGTVTALLNGHHFEITTLRKDISCDGRHATVEYSTDFEEDAARRDFTINALSYCPFEHKIYDYFGGLEDLEGQKVVFIGNAEERICEDYLRILRFFRFSSRYAKEIDLLGFEACIKFKDKLNNLSRERIKLEMDNLLCSDNPSRQILLSAPNIMKIMQESGILSIIFPIDSYDSDSHLRAISVFRQVNIEFDPIVIYAILFASVEKISAKELINLKFSRSESNQIISLLTLKEAVNNKNIKYKLMEIWSEEKQYSLYFIFMAAMNSDDKFILDLYNDLKEKPMVVFPVNGNDLMKLGYKNNDLGIMIKTLKKQWVESGFSLTKSELINLAKNN